MGADVVIIMTDQERAAPGYEGDELTRWRRSALAGRQWFGQHGVSFRRHYTGSVACVPSRPTLFTGQYPYVHELTQTDGLAKTATDSAMRWLPPGSVPTLGNWFRAAGYDTAYVGKWHISHADLTDGDGSALPTNTDAGEELPANVAAYREADVLAPYGFAGWIGPEPHGPGLANTGLRRDPLTAARTVGWLHDRYQRRRLGDADAVRPFLLVVSFVNPHDIVFFPAWFDEDPLPALDPPPPPVPPSPTDAEDLATKPAAQRAFRDCYPSAYGPADVIRARYLDGGDRYRALYHRLHHLVDDHIERVRRAVTDEQAATGGDVVLVRTADHGELLGAHGGLHQKWFNLYDEGTRVPFQVVRLGRRATVAGTVTAPTSHVDVVPTLLAEVGADVDAIAARLGDEFATVVPFPGRDLSGALDDPVGAVTGDVYLMTRDNVLEGDSDASLLARALGHGDDPPPGLRIAVPEGAGTCFEAIVTMLAGDDGALRTWKLVRTSGAGGDVDEWELYDLDADPVEAHNLAAGGPQGGRAHAAVLAELTARLAASAARAGAAAHVPGSPAFGCGARQP